MSDRGSTPGDVGLTLIEMLIVLSIIAIAAGATVLSLAPRHGNATEAEARLLASTMQAAVDRSIATGSRETLAVDQTGYTVGSTARHAFPAETSVVDPGTKRSLAFDEAQPFALVVVHGRDRWSVSFDGLRVLATPVKDAG